MGVERGVVLSFARQIGDDVANAVVENLKSMTQFLQSGDDSGLVNMWEELCVQVQGEEIADYAGYEVAVDSCIEDSLDTLAPHERFALWLATDAGFDWSCDQQDDDEKPPIELQDIIEELRPLVISKAGDFENENIRRYRWRLESGEAEEFALTDDDYSAIEIAMNVARGFITHPKIEPEQAAGLENALYALERLPLVTLGSSCEFGVVYRAGTMEFSEMRYIDFRISEHAFEISKGGSVYNKAVGSDSFSDPGWLIEVGDQGARECDLYNLEKTIDEYLNLGAEIKVSDESEIDN